MTLPADGGPAAIQAVSGDGQSGSVGATLAEPLVVVVKDALERPVVGVRVAFAASHDDEVSPDTATTGSDGRAQARLRLGPAAGTEEVAAVVVGANALRATFTAVAAPGEAAALVKVSGDGQSAPARTELAAPLVVRVTDDFGNPIAGVVVTWAAQGGGSVSDEETTTGADGQASVTRTLGRRTGIQTTTAAAAGLDNSPITFTSTATFSFDGLLSPGVAAATSDAFVAEDD